VPPDRFVGYLFQTCRATEIMQCGERTFSEFGQGAWAARTPGASSLRARSMSFIDCSETATIFMRCYH
jgi:hypothetical protein